MSLPKRMAKRREQDAELERKLDLRKYDPVVEAYGGIRYTPLDIEELENERIPWLRRKRQRGY